MTNQQIALNLLDRLIQLDAERNAMAGILVHVKTQYNLPLDWQKAVKSECGPLGKAQDDARQTFAKLDSQIRSSDPSSIDGLAILASVPLVPIWEYPKQTSL